MNQIAHICHTKFLAKLVSHSNPVIVIQGSENVPENLSPPPLIKKTLLKKSV